MPSYFIILILNLIFLLSILSLLFSASLISEFFFTVMNSIVSVFLISKLTVFRTPYSITILLTFYRTFTTSFILLSIMNPRLSIKDRQVIWGIFSFTSLNTPLIYIKKRIGDTGELCGIPVRRLKIWFCIIGWYRDYYNSLSLNLVFISVVYTIYRIYKVGSIHSL